MVVILFTEQVKMLKPVINFSSFYHTQS